MDTKLDRTPTPAPRRAADRPPALTGVMNGIVKGLARAGIRLGPNALLTVRGRRSGQARTTPVAVVEIGGRRWVQCPFGEVQWVRNLRAAGEGTLSLGRRSERVRAVELTGEDAVAFFRDTLAPYLRRQRLGRTLAGVLGLGDVLQDPAGAARRHPVFELTPAER
jgi:deazaflavin-dependent oxidoreductase (nitroreductase family)